MILPVIFIIFVIFIIKSIILSGFYPYVNRRIIITLLLHITVIIIIIIIEMITMIIIAPNIFIVCAMGYLWQIPGCFEQISTNCLDFMTGSAVNRRSPNGDNQGKRRYTCDTRLGPNGYDRSTRYLFKC